LLGSHADDASLSKEYKLLVFFVEHELQSLESGVRVRREVVGIIQDFKASNILEGLVDSHFLANSKDNEVITTFSLEDLNGYSRFGTDEGNFKDYVSSRVEEQGSVV
jgi:hypothetical protein